MADRFLQKIPAASPRVLTNVEAEWVRRRLAENRINKFLLVLVVASAGCALISTIGSLRLVAFFAVFPGLVAGILAIRIAGKTKGALVAAQNDGLFASHGIRIEKSSPGHRGLAGWIYALKKDVWTLLDPGDTVEMQMVPGARIRLEVETDGHVRCRIGPVKF